MTMQRSKTIAAVSGGFDPLHAEHIRLFIEAKKYADKLVVIVDSDEFVTRKHRVLLPQWRRAFVIGELGMVDLVLMARYEDVCSELRSVKPDVYVTGSDHRGCDRAEFEVCREIGTEIVHLNCERTISSSAIADRFYDDLD
jgi:cytidyltransferase-like protein